MNEQERHNLFSQLVTCHQSQLYAYIFALVRNREDAEDLFQSVCVILWRKFDSFQPDSSFFSWARQTAIFAVRNALKRKKSVYVSEELLDALAETNADACSDATDVYLAVLGGCKKKLDAADEHLLDLRYVENLSSRQIASQTGRSQQGVCNSLMRIRRSLFDCIQIEMARQEHSTRASHE
jgi:RNA polymerase sigma-70 factor (ECF subfamily)